jgi:hypothetical protein
MARACTSAVSPVVLFVQVAAASSVLKRELLLFSALTSGKLSEEVRPVA